MTEQKTAMTDEDTTAAAIDNRWEDVKAHARAGEHSAAHASEEARALCLLADLAHRADRQRGACLQLGCSAATVEAYAAGRVPGDEREPTARAQPAAAPEPATPELLAVAQDTARREIADWLCDSPEDINASIRRAVENYLLDNPVLVSGAVRAAVGGYLADNPGALAPPDRG